MLALLLAPVSARADLLLSVDSVVALAGSSGNSLDVELTNTGSPVTIGGFSFGVVTPGSDISFTDANTSTALTYIFAGNSLFGPDLTGPVAGQSLSTSDVFATPGGGTTLGTGATVSLANLLFDVSAGASAGVFPVAFEPFPVTSLSDASGNNLDISTLSAGSITIEPTAVPEPSTLALLAGFLILTCAARRRSISR